MKKSLRFAVLFSVILTLLFGCGKNGSTKDTADDISISNLKTSASSLTPEEKERMDTVTDMLKTAEFLVVDSYDYSLAARNTSAHDLDMYLYITGFAEDGSLVYTNTMQLHHWQKGQKLAFAQTVSFSDDVKKLMLTGEYMFNNTWYMTDPVPLSMNEGSDSDVTLQYADILPAVVRVEQNGWNAKTASYSLLDFSIRNNLSSDSFILTLKVRKESGTDNASEEIPVRILDKDGNVHCSDNAYVYLKRGETALLTYNIDIYEPGEYYLELK